MQLDKTNTGLNHETQNLLCTQSWEHRLHFTISHLTKVLLNEHEIKGAKPHEARWYSHQKQSRVRIHLSLSPRSVAVRTYERVRTRTFRIELLPCRRVHMPNARTNGMLCVHVQSYMLLPRIANHGMSRRGLYDTCTRLAVSVLSDHEFMQLSRVRGTTLIWKQKKIDTAGRHPSQRRKSSSAPTAPCTQYRRGPARSARISVTR